MNGIRAVFNVPVLLSTARALRKRERWTAEQMREWQQRQFTDLVRFANEHSPFYRRLYAGIEVSGVLHPRDLPPVDKAMIMDHFDEVVTDPRLRLAEILENLGRSDGVRLFKKRFRILSTSGTSGRRGLFVLDRREWITILALMLRWQRFTGLRPRIGRRKRIATIGAGNAMHASRLLPLGGDIGLYEFRFLSAAAPLDEIVRDLNAFRPDVLASYASIAGLLALEQFSGRLSIQPQIVVTHSELLTDSIAARIERAWGSRPFNYYGLSEMPCLGIDCAFHRGIHIFEDLCVIEPVDSSGNPVAPGEVADKFYLTNLVNRAQPLIRYEVTDRIAVSPPDCPCGSPFSLIRKMQGRDDDVMELEGLAGGLVRIPALALTLGVEDLPGVVEHEISFAESPPSIEILILADSTASREGIGKRVSDEMESIFARFRVKRPALTISFVDAFPRNHQGMGKKKILRRNGGTTGA